MRIFAATGFTTDAQPHNLCATTPAPVAVTRPTTGHRACGADWVIANKTEHIDEVRLTETGTTRTLPFFWVSRFRQTAARNVLKKVSGSVHVQATLGGGSVKFCTVGFCGAFFNSFHCVPRVLPDTLVLRYMMFMFCVEAALLAKRAFVACFASWYIVMVLVVVHHVLDKAQSTVHGPLVQEVAVLSLVPLPGVQIIWQSSMSGMGRLQHMTLHR